MVHFEPKWLPMGAPKWAKKPNVYTFFPYEVFWGHLKLLSAPSGELRNFIQ